MDIHIQSHLNPVESKGQNLIGFGFSPIHSQGAFFIFILKKTKFQKYMSNRKIFKNWATRCCRPSSGRQDLNVKKFTFRSWRQDALNSELVKLI